MNESRTEIKSVKECFENDEVLVIDVICGKNECGITAEPVYHAPDEDEVFVKWASKRYINRLCHDNYGIPIEDLNCYRK